MAEHEGTEHEVAETHAMDLPHVAAVELPLVVKNTEKATRMIGGKDKISQTINSLDKQTYPGGQNAKEKVLELRLRENLFHHPIQSLLSTKEKVLLKISLPKRNLPQDYKTGNYSAQELIHCCTQKGHSPHVQPVGIINKTFLFKGIADFQVQTKHNSTLNQFNDLVVHPQGFESIKKLYQDRQNFSAILDYKNSSEYENKDHHFPPPPVLSPIRFPFDYRYQRNPLTSIVRDEESGEIKVIAKKGTIKLYTKIVDFFTQEIPNEPAVELQKNSEHLEKSNLAVNSIEYDLRECIRWLKRVFQVKPIWLRKHLEDVVPFELRRVIKQALPYVSYIYKNGPWRFCNVNFGINPKDNCSYWKYQSEYFRIPGLHFHSSTATDSAKIIPRTIEEDRNSNLAVSEYLFFTGKKLPATVTYQVGDIMDDDICAILQDSKLKLGDEFYRVSPDFQDGWINKQAMETIRRIIRYKLSRIVKDLPIEPEKIAKIVSTDFAESEANMDIEDGDQDKLEHDGEQEGEEQFDDEQDDFEGGYDDQSEQEDNQDKESAPGGDEEDIISKLMNSSDLTASKVQGLKGFVKQDLIHAD